MNVAYLDTSALLKRYVAETGSDWVRTFLAASEPPVVFTSHLTIVEATCAFARRLRDKTLSPDAHSKLLQAFDYDIKYKYHLLDIMPVTIETARQLANRHPLRAYDAVQLATAWLLNQELLRADQPALTFICADDRLIATAQTEGLLSENPTHHP